VLVMVVGELIIDFRIVFFDLLRESKEVLGFFVGLGEGVSAGLRVGIFDGLFDGLLGLSFMFNTRIWNESKDISVFSLLYSPRGWRV
jgi:hypothetical protein